MSACAPPGLERALPSRQYLANVISFDRTNAVILYQGLSPFILMIQTPTHVLLQQQRHFVLSDLFSACFVPSFPLDPRYPEYPALVKLVFFNWLVSLLSFHVMYPLRHSSQPFIIDDLFRVVRSAHTHKLYLTHQAQPILPRP
jgi:hypothetical protein